MRAEPSPAQDAELRLERELLADYESDHRTETMVPGTPLKIRAVADRAA
ncbi:MAG: hypothetical protein KDJ19_03755 [Hyphomicrobiaceae bacterium]|nr:hypothetical protein [Hyphomicrobiaceae bacterium]MCC0023182.1 hypothetical protein [Hyphomicrobiaceae bacterium]